MLAITWMTSSTQCPGESMFERKVLPVCMWLKSSKSFSARVDSLMTLLKTNLLPLVNPRTLMAECGWLLVRARLSSAVNRENGGWKGESQTRISQTLD